MTNDNEDRDLEFLNNAYKNYKNNNSNSQQVFQNAERIGQNQFINQQLQDQQDRQKYNSFLADQGISPDTIGSSRIDNQTSKASHLASLAQQEQDPIQKYMYARALQSEISTPHGMHTPSLHEQENAVNAANISQSMEGRLRDAALQSSKYFNPLNSAIINNQLEQQQVQRNGVNNNYGSLKSYWLNKLSNPSNGFVNPSNNYPSTGNYYPIKNTSLYSGPDYNYQGGNNYYNG